MRPLPLLLLLVSAALIGGGVLLLRKNEEPAPEVSGREGEIELPHPKVEPTTPEARPDLPARNRGIRPPTVPPHSSDLAILGTPPQWSKLTEIPTTRTMTQLLAELQDVYSIGDEWQNYIRFTGGGMEVLTEEEKWLTIPIAAIAGAATPAEKAIDGVTALNQPLAGLKIVIDPGHIGGRWAQIEERHFRIDNGIAVQEGDMTLKTALHLEEQLRELGAIVSLARQETEPVTSLRPDDFIDYARDRWGQPENSAVAQKQRESLFYRTAEIRARANYVNKILQPDLVLCLHFNAESWGDPENPQLIEDEHFHMLVNGGYTTSEWAQQDTRYELISRLLRGTHAVEKRLSQAVVATIRDATNLRPYAYEANSRRAKQVTPDNYIWARNLLANRLYEAPVLFFEPYLMNGRDTYLRVQAGDYEGVLEVNGRIRPSLYREYASAITEGLRNAFK